MIKVYRDETGCTMVQGEEAFRINGFSIDDLFQEKDPYAWLSGLCEGSASIELMAEPESQAWLPPIGSQEIWAAGVTYFRSREARMEEAENAGGDVFYDKVYDADRPELFFKATPARARGHRAGIRIRRDSEWDVPEPELTLAINRDGRIFGFTIGDDVSSRSIEGENPLYLPQAKVYKGSCAIGPALCVTEGPLPKETTIRLEILRAGAEGFTGETRLDQLKRGLDELVGYLFDENEFPEGSYLMTGTGIVPDDFTLAAGDEVRISIEGLGTLINTVEA
ncbi:MAG: fumarylacetoacetate hydrolase family protein [Verrucomicrobiota bacterium]